MKAFLVQLDDPILLALNRVAPAAERQCAEYIRAPIRKAIREAEEERTRCAYQERPAGHQDCGRQLVERPELKAVKRYELSWWSATPLGNQACIGPRLGVG